MKTLLLAGGGLNDIPIIIAAQRMGFRVVTTGNRPNSIGHRYSDEYICADYTSKAELLEIALNTGASYICPCANDYSAITCAFVAEKLGLPGHDGEGNAIILHRKDLFREFTKKNGIPAPYAQAFCSVSDALQFIRHNSKMALIIKPVDSSGGQGIHELLPSTPEINIKEILEQAFHASKIKKIIIEQFIQGTNHGFSAILMNRKIKFYFIDNEHYHLSKYMVTGASHPSSVPERLIPKLIKDCEKIAEKLGLVDGLFHVQLIVQGMNYYIIEVCRRTPGDLYVNLVSYAAGIDYSSCIVKGFCGIDLHDCMEPVNPPVQYVTRHCIFSHENGIFNNIRFSPEIRNNIIDYFQVLEKGDEISDCRKQKIGIAFVQYKDKQEMRAKLNRLTELIRPVVGLEIS